MANLYSGTHSFTGYKALSELSELTFEAKNKYSIQIIGSNQEFYAREGETGDGFKSTSSKPFDWEYDGANDLYIGYFSGGTVYINVAG